MKKNLEEIIQTLKEVPFFKKFANYPEKLKIIAEKLTYKKVKKGTIIIKEGEVGDVLYILKSGTVEIVKKTLEKEEYTVVTLKSDERNVVFFGELALLDSDRRSATVIAKTDCELLLLTRKNFIELGNKHPEIGLYITRELSKILAGRLRKANEDIITLFEALVGEVSESGKL